MCYSKEQKAGVYRDMSQNQEDNINENNADEPNVSIIDIIYDPPGNDTTNEQVKVQNNNSMTYQVKDLWLQVGDKTSKTYIYHDLWSHEEKIFIGNYRLPNTKATCVNLMYKNTLLDTYCYDPKEDTD